MIDKQNILIFFRENGERVEVPLPVYSSPVTLSVSSPKWEIPPWVLIGTPYEGESLYFAPPKV